MVIRLTFGLNITPKSVKMHTIFLQNLGLPQSSIGSPQTLNGGAYSAPDTPWLSDLVTKVSRIVTGKITL